MKNNFFNLKNSLKHSKYVLLIIIFAILLLPKVIVMPSETDVRGIITTIGFDNINDQLEISAQIFVPTASPSYKEKFDIVSVQSGSVVEGLKKIAIQIGKTIGLAHTTSIVFGSTMLSSNLSLVLDYFMRVNSVSNSAILIGTNLSAKDLIETSSTLTVDGLLNLRRIASFNEQSVLFTDISLESYFKGYFGPTKSSLLSYIELETLPQENQQNNQSEDQEQKQKTKYALKNQGDVIVIKNGKMLNKLTENDLHALSFLNPKYKTGYIKLENLENSNFGKYNLVYNFSSKKISHKCYFENNTPTIETNYNLTIKLNSIETKSFSKDIIESDNTYYNNQVKYEIEKQISQSTTNLIQKLQNQNTDLIGGTSTLFKTLRKQIEENYKTDEQKEKIFKQINYKKPTFKIKIEF